MGGREGGVARVRKGTRADEGREGGEQGGREGGENMDGGGSGLHIYFLFVGVWDRFRPY